MDALRPVVARNTTMTQNQPTVPVKRDGAAVDVNSWLDRFFDSYYRHRPVNATFIGVHDFDDRLPDYSNNGVADVTGEMWTLLDQADAIDRQQLSTAQAIDLTLAVGYLRTQLWEFGSGHFQNGNPAVYTSEAVFGPLSLLLREGAPLQARLDAAFGRFERVPRLLAQGRENIARAPRRWIEKAMDECLGGAKLATEGVGLFLAEHGVEHAQLIEAAGRAAQAFDDHRRYLRDEMLPSALDEGYSCGPDGLDLSIRESHQLAVSADEIAEQGRAEMERCKQRLADGAAAFGGAGWRDVLAELAEIHPPADAYLDAFQRTWETAQALALQYDLVTWPDYPIRYVERYYWVRSAAPHLYFLFYRAPATFDAVDVVDYLVEPLPAGDPEPVLRAHHWGQIKLNHVVHHGGIGHHVQNWHAYRAESRIGRVAAVDCASRIAMLCGGTMAEGWSCYTTELMDEFGFCTPLESLSQVQSRLRMAARAVVDVELHQGKMTLDEAAAFYRDEAGMADGAAYGEAVKNSMNPGAALMYLTGTDQIHALRREMIGDRTGLPLRAFHDRFLSHGSIPVSMIAASMRAGNLTESSGVPVQ